MLNSTSAVCRRVQNQNGSGTSISKNNAKTVRDRNTAADITEAADGDDDDDEGNSDEGSENATKDEDGEGGGGEGTGSQFKRRQARSFYFTTGAVKRIESKEDSTLPAICQVGGHAECSKSIPGPTKALRVYYSTSASFTKPSMSRSGL